MKRRGFIALLAGYLLISFSCIAHAICNPSLVRLLDRGDKFVQIRSGNAPRLGTYFIRWFGHSSFLIQSASQTKVITDPNFNVTPGIQVDAVTVSNDHYTHNNIETVSGNPLILRGITLQQTWNPIRTQVKDITIANIPSQRGPGYEEVANSIFIFHMERLCIAHLGNIGHLLTPEQEKFMQRVDIMMIPIDARNNLGFEDLVKVIEQVRPPIVIPMHYDDPSQADLFAGFIRERFAIRRIKGSELHLSRSVLPKSTEIFILTHPHPIFPWE